MSVDYIILGIISYYPCSGYDIKLESEHKNHSLVWGGLSYGSIYPRLQKLEKDGLIYTYESEDGGRKKKIYELTEKGWEALYDWVAAKAAPLTIQDELMLKMGFAGTTRPEDRDLMIRHLRKRKHEVEEQLEEYIKWPQNGVSAITEYSMLVIERSIELMKADLAWIDKAILQLEGPPKPFVQDPKGLLEQLVERRRQGLKNKRKSGDHT